MAAADVLVLDIGNVCLRIDPDACARLLGAKSMKRFVLRRPWLLAAIRALETGRLSDREFAARVRRATNGRYSAEQILLAWNAILGEEIPGMAAVVRQAVATGLRVVLFSDTSEVHYRALLPRLSFAALVDGAILSFEVGAMKPAEAMYAAVEERYCGGRVPRLFVDDKAINVRAARNRGWPSYRFGDAAGVRAALSFFANAP